jgi:hypothetical protein
MPSVPLRLALLSACALAVVAPAHAQKPPPGVPAAPGGSQTGAQTTGEGKKSPYSAVDPTTGAPAASPPTPVVQQTPSKRKSAVTVNSGKKSADSADESVDVTTQVTPPAATPPATTTPVATTPVVQKKSSGTKRHSSTKRSSTRRSTSPSGGTLAAAVTTPASTTPNPAKHDDGKAAHRTRQSPGTPRTSVVTRTVHDIVKVIPGPLKAALVGLAALLLAALAGWIAVTFRARHLKRQRHELLAEVGLLQAALLPEVPERVGPLAASAAYRPADGPAAGGDFYDVFEMEDGRIGVVLGDVAGHGREALARTATPR